MKKCRWVYIVKHEYDGGGGYSWFLSLKLAVKALAAEKRSILELADQMWAAILIPMPAPDDLDLNDGDAVESVINTYIEALKL